MCILTTDCVLSRVISITWRCCKTFHWNGQLLHVLFSWRIITCFDVIFMMEQNDVDDVNHTDVGQWMTAVIKLPRDGSISWRPQPSGPQKLLLIITGAAGGVGGQRVWCWQLSARISLLQNQITTGHARAHTRSIIFRISVLGVSWTSWGYKISGQHDWSWST